MTANWQHVVDLLSAAEWKTLFSTDLLPLPLHPLLPCLQVSKAALKRKKALVLSRFSMRFSNVQQKLATPEVSLRSNTAPPPLPSDTPQNSFFFFYKGESWKRKYFIRNFKKN